MEVLEEPIQAPCEHTFCKACIQAWLDQGNRSCPVDRQELSSDSFKPLTRMTQQLLNKLTVRCKNHVDGCHLQCKLEYVQQLIKHEQRWCQAVHNEEKSEIRALKEKITELQKKIERSDKVIREQEKTIAHLQKLNNESKGPVEASDLSPSAPPLELLESTSTTPVCPELVNEDSIQGKKCILVIL